MTDNLQLAPKEMAEKVIELAFTHLAEWPMKSAEAFRNAVLGECMFAFNPLMDIDKNIEVAYLHRTLKETVAQGCMIDFGFIPNDVLKVESTRSRELFESGELPHPFDRWLGVTKWEGGFNAYLIIANPQNEKQVLVFEMYGISMPDQICDIVLVYDVVSIEIGGLDHTRVYPMEMIAPDMNEQEELEKRGANSLDPMITMLRLLADASVPIEHRPPPDKLNKIRVKQGKFPIPAYTVVNARDYITTFHHPSKIAGKGGKHGTHASPTAHWRKAHKRVLADGRIIPVKSSRVNWRSSEELHRMFYKTE